MDAEKRDIERILLFSTGGITALLLLLLSLVLYHQLGIYKAGVDFELASGNADTASVLAYARSADFAIAKTSSLFLGFVLVFVGTMFVLRVSQVDYQLSVNDGNQRGGLTMSSSSPGLVLATLGVLLIALVLFTRSEVTLSERAPTNDAEVVSSSFQIAEDIAD